MHLEGDWTSGRRRWTSGESETQCSCSWRRMPVSQGVPGNSIMDCQVWRRRNGRTGNSSLLCAARCLAANERTWLASFDITIGMDRS